MTIQKRLHVGITKKDNIKFLIFVSLKYQPLGRFISYKKLNNVSNFLGKYLFIAQAGERVAIH